MASGQYESVETSVDIFEIVGVYSSSIILLEFVLKLILFKDIKYASK